MLWVIGGVWGVKLDAVIVAEVLAYTTRGVEEVLALSENVQRGWRYGHPGSVRCCEYLSPVERVLTWRKFSYRCRAAAGSNVRRD